MHANVAQSTESARMRGHRFDFVQGTLTQEYGSSLFAQAMKKRKEKKTTRTLLYYHGQSGDNKVGIQQMAIEMTIGSREGTGRLKANLHEKTKEMVMRRKPQAFLVSLSGPWSIVYRKEDLAIHRSEACLQDASHSQLVQVAAGCLMS